jgi:RNA polymerase sigma-70 factor (ECF subfamily)
MDSARRKTIHDAMVRLSDGDRSAFDVLLDELWPVVLSFAERGIGRAADAEDIAQEVFYRICSRISDFDRNRDGLSWAFGIASYEIMTHRKRALRRREVHDETVLAAETDQGASQEEVLIDRELMLAFEHAMGALTDEDRIVLGLVPNAVGLGPASPALRKRKQRAVDRLRGLWRNIYGDA